MCSEGVTLSTQTEKQLIDLVEQNILVSECKREWMHRWGLDYPFIRTPFGIILYGEVFK